MLVIFRRLEDLVAHEDIISIITNLIDNDQLPHLLLYGPPGTGMLFKNITLLVLDVVPDLHKYCMNNEHLVLRAIAS